jgi:hypothetical protein
MSSWLYSIDGSISRSRSTHVGLIDVLESERSVCTKWKKRRKR